METLLIGVEPVLLSTLFVWIRRWVLVPHLVHLMVHTTSAPVLSLRISCITMASLIHVHVLTIILVATCLLLEITTFPSSVHAAFASVHVVRHGIIISYSVASLVVVAGVSHLSTKSLHTVLAVRIIPHQKVSSCILVSSICKVAVLVVVLGTLVSWPVIPIILRVVSIEAAVQGTTCTHLLVILLSTSIVVVLFVRIVHTSILLLLHTMIVLRSFSATVRVLHLIMILALPIVHLFILLPLIIYA